LKNVNKRFYDENGIPTEIKSYYFENEENKRALSPNLYLPNFFQLALYQVKKKSQSSNKNYY
jgi:hypothetical protein